MFQWLYRLLFARRAKWVLECYSDDGTRNRIVIRIWDPSKEDLESQEEACRVWEELGWTVIHRPVDVKRDNGKC